LRQDDGFDPCTRELRFGRKHELGLPQAIGLGNHVGVGLNEENVPGADLLMAAATEDVAVIAQMSVDRAGELRFDRGRRLTGKWRIGSDAELGEEGTRPARLSR
jgi:hypothetical protein